MDYLLPLRICTYLLGGMEILSKASRPFTALALPLRPRLEERLIGVAVPALRIARGGPIGGEGHGVPPEVPPQERHRGEVLAGVGLSQRLGESQIRG